jgi:hypothetical protein
MMDHAVAFVRWVLGGGAKPFAVSRVRGALGKEVQGACRIYS